MPTCRECGKPIDFIKMKTGRYMPVEKYGLWCKPDKYGDRRVITAAGEIVNASKCSPDEKGRIFGNIPHWQECQGAQKIKDAQKAKAQKKPEPAPKKPEPPKIQQLSML